MCARFLLVSVSPILDSDPFFAPLLSSIASLPLMRRRIDFRELVRDLFAVYKVRHARHPRGKAPSPKRSLTVQSDSCSGFACLGPCGSGLCRRWIPWVTKAVWSLACGLSSSIRSPCPTCEFLSACRVSNTV